MPATNVTTIAARRAKKSASKTATKTPSNKAAGAANAATPAEIPAEAIAAQNTTYEPLFPVADVVPHPLNPRHNAVADDELLQSIKDQGLIHDLVLSPHPELAGKAYLIDGHRRLDALLRNGFSHAPAKIRHDLTDEASQVAAMLATIRREDLTPVEEAEGFDFLIGKGWTVDQVAAKTGRSKTTINERRRLTQLKDRAKGAIDSGQITIDDAIRIAKLPAAEQTRLERYVGTLDFRLEVGRVESRVRAQREVDDTAKQLRKDGVPELSQPKDANYPHSLTYTQHSMVRLSTTGRANREDHDGCLAFVRARPAPTPAIWYVCTDPAKHDDDLSADQAARAKQLDEEEAAREVARAERERVEESQRVARILRADNLMAAIKPKALDPALDALLRAAFPSLMSWMYDYLTPELFFDLAGVPEDQRSGSHHDSTEPWLEELDRLTGPALVKMLAAFLIAKVEHDTENAFRFAQIDDPGDLDRRTTRSYFAVLTSLGHELNSADQELIAAVAGDSRAATQEA